MTGINIFLKIFILSLAVNTVTTCTIMNCNLCNGSEDKKCLKCEESFFSEDGTCVKCSDNCISCSNSQECQTCKLFYKMASNKRCTADIKMVAYVAFITGFLFAATFCYLLFCFICTKKNKKRWRKKHRKDKRRGNLEGEGSDRYERNSPIINQVDEERQGGAGNPHPIFSEEDTGSYVKPLVYPTKYDVRQPAPNLYANGVY